MIPSRDDLIRRAKLPDYSAGEGYVQVPLSDWDAVLWFLDQAESMEGRAAAAEEALRLCRQWFGNDNLSDYEAHELHSQILAALAAVPVKDKP